MTARFHAAFRATCWVFLCVLAACAGSRCDASKVADGKASLPSKTPTPDLRLLVLTDPRGYLEPCGCQLRPLGGLDKLATVVGDARRDGVPTLVLAAGNLAFGTELRPEDAEGARAQELFRSETFVEIYARLGVSAVAPGPLDLAQEQPLLTKLVAKSSVPWLVDNAQARGEQQLPFATGRVLDARGIKVGVLGLSLPAPSGSPAWLELDSDAAQIARKKSAELRSQGAQLVVALVSGDRRAARTLAGKGVDVVVMGGLDLEKALPPALVGDTVLVHAGQQGQHVLALELGLHGASGWEDASDWSARETNRELSQQIAELRERVQAWEKDEKVARKDLEVQRARLRELEQQRDAPRQLSFAGRWFRAELEELAPEVAGERAITALLDAHDQRVNEHNRTTLADKKPLPAAPGAAAYVGSQACESCHQQAYKWWRGTPHGNAYLTLERVHKQFNLNCVSCHVTGYNQPGGSTVTHVDALKDVGCENCHGPGSLHVAEPSKAGLVTRTVEESTCSGCHTHEHSDRFVYDSFKAMLIAPGHGLPADRQ